MLQLILDIYFHYLKEVLEMVSFVGRHTLKMMNTLFLACQKALQVKLEMLHHGGIFFFFFFLRFLSVG